MKLLKLFGLHKDAPPPKPEPLIAPMQPLPVPKPIQIEAPARLPAPDLQIGNVEPICPYCQHPLDKKPLRKKQCPFCKCYMHIRTRPSDRQQIIVTEEGIDLIALEWDIVNDPFPYPNFNLREVISNARQELSQTLGRSPSGTEVRLRVIELRATAHVKRLNWGLYRNALLETAEIFERQGKAQLALDRYLEICYVDVSGAANASGKSADMLHTTFNTSMGVLAPGIVNHIGTLASSLDLSRKRLHQMFLDIIQQRYVTTHLLLAPEIAWSKIGPKLQIY